MSNNVFPLHSRFSILLFSDGVRTTQSYRHSQFILPLLHAHNKRNGAVRVFDCNYWHSTEARVGWPRAGVPVQGVGVETE